MRRPSRPLLCLTLALIAGLPHARAADRPDILWITSEDNAAQWLGCYGNREAPTPVLDRMAMRASAPNAASLPLLSKDLGSSDPLRRHGALVGCMLLPVAEIRSRVPPDARFSSGFGLFYCHNGVMNAPVHQMARVPNPSPRHLSSRRRAIGRLASLLAMGAWPGARAAQESGVNTAVNAIRFVVINDFHHQDENCNPWMERIFRQVAVTENAAFCFGLGDLADKGKRTSLEAMKRLSVLAGMPFFPCPGNHDNDESPVNGFYTEVFPERRNYVVRHSGWQFVVLDSTEGNKWEKVAISTDTLGWLDQTLPSLDALAPTVLCTHFPLATEVKMCPINADAVLARFIGHNLRGTFGGHFHGRTSTPRGAIRLVTNACVARVRDNHDGTADKGYLVVDGAPDGRLTTAFVVC